MHPELSVAITDAVLDDAVLKGAILSGEETANEALHAEAREADTLVCAAATLRTDWALENILGRCNSDGYLAFKVTGTWDFRCPARDRGRS